jgi:hypothetical protein
MSFQGCYGCHVPWKIWGDACIYVGVGILSKQRVHFYERERDKPELEYRVFTSCYA